MHIGKNKISKTNSSIPKSGIFNQNQENEDSFSSQINFPITKKKTKQRIICHADCYLVLVKDLLRNAGNCYFESFSKHLARKF